MRWPRIWKHPLFWLALMLLGFIVVSVAAGTAAYYNSFSGRGDYDGGIITQAVASTTFGHFAPFYESADCMQNGRCSFLLVHPGFILYLAVPFYALAPSMVTLFALRSLVVAAAAVPLYWLTRQVTCSPWKGLIAAGLYLVWAPTLAGDVFSLHLESLFPLEFFTLAALWQAGRYRWGLFTALIAFMTFEITPIFVFLVAFFFLIPPLQEMLGPLRRFLRSRRAREESATIPWRQRILNFWRPLRSRAARYTLLLLGISIVAYVVLASFMNIWGSTVLGVASLIVPKGEAGLFYNKASHPIFNLGVLLHSPATVHAALFWLILYALVAFIPLLSPRALVIALPWMGWTFVQNSDSLTGIGQGHQYTMIAAVPVFIGLAYGLRRVSPRVPVPAASRNVEETGGPTGFSESPERLRRRRRVRAGAWVAVLLVVIVANLLFSPINPALPDLGVKPGLPFSSTYFYDPFNQVPGYTWLKQLTSVIPENASVLAATSLFPLVANFPRAIELAAKLDSSKVAHLPFNVSSGPEFFLMDLPSLPASGSYLASLVANASTYGVRAYVDSTGDGPVLLYEHGYHLAAEQFGPASGPVRSAWTPPSGLDPGPLGVTVPNASAKSGEAIEVPSGNDRTGPICTAGPSFLPPGTYFVRLTVGLVATDHSINSNAPILRIAATGYSGGVSNASYSIAEIGTSGWGNVSMTLTTSSPVPEFKILVILTNPEVRLAIASVELDSPPY